MLSRDRFNSRARSIECAYPAGAVAAFHAEMILQRLDRDRARNALAIDQRRKYHREIRVAIRRRIGGKKDVHGGLEWQGNGNNARSYSRRLDPVYPASSMLSRTSPAGTSTISSDTASGSA